MSKQHVTAFSIESEIDTIEYMIPQTALSMTICVMRMKNGFAMVGKSACVNPENYNQEYGQRLALEDAKRQAWQFLGWRLADKNARKKMTLEQIEKAQASENVQEPGKQMIVD